jgi:hypothetical protein
MTTIVIVRAVASDCSNARGMLHQMRKWRDHYQTTVRNTSLLEVAVSCLDPMRQYQLSMQETGKF